MGIEVDGSCTVIGELGTCMCDIKISHNSDFRAHSKRWCGCLDCPQPEHTALGNEGINNATYFKMILRSSPGRYCY